MKLPPYPKYKPSGVEWLGDIAHDWTVSSIKHLVETPVTDGPHETPEIYDEGIPFVSAEAVSGGRINFEKIRGHITAEDHKRFSRKYKPRRGDIYLIKSGATTGRVAMVETDTEFNIWSPLAAIRCEPKMADRQFLFFYLQSREFQTAVELSWSFGTQQNIGMGVIQNLAVPLPSLPEQRSIAAFLDRATGRVDRLVAKKRELIERLKEKRSALISRAVTRGLPPAAARAAGLHANPPLKPSGLDWLGDIPKHWEEMTIKRVALSMICGPFGSSLTKDKYTESGYRVYGQEQVIPGDFSIGDYYISTDYFSEMKRYEVRAGDVLVSCVGTFGKVAVVPGDIEPGIINPRLILIRPDRRRIDSDYMGILIRSHFAHEQLQATSRGGTMDIINLGLMGDLMIPLPPLPEQAAIASYLDRETAKLDALVRKVAEAVERLQEYRSALITAAVTGKIDVRPAKRVTSTSP